jgi:hypothetical protein
MLKLIRNRAGLVLAGLLAALAPMLMAPTGGFPSRPQFQAVGIGVAAPATVGSLQLSQVTATADAMQFILQQPSASADQKNWILRTGGSPAGTLAISTATDAAPTVAVNNALVCTRTGTTVNSCTVNGGAITSGSFTGTLTGMTAVTTGTINYSVTNSVCTLWINSPITGTSNSTAMTITGTPAACTPVSQSRQSMVGSLEDNGVGDFLGACEVAVSTGVITVGIWQTNGSTAGSKLIVSPTGFTASGTKGILNDWTCSYPVQ